MDVVNQVLQVLKVVVFSDHHEMKMFEFLLGREELRKRRWRPVAEKPPRDPVSLKKWIAANADLVGKAGRLRWLIDALSGSVELPSVVPTPKRTSFNPHEREARSTVRAAGIDEMSLSVLTAIQRKIVTHDGNELAGLAREVRAQVEGLPESTNVPSSMGLWPGVLERYFLTLNTNIGHSVISVRLPARGNSAA